MTPQTQTSPEQDQTVEKTIQQLREVYRDAPEMAKVALERALPALKSQALEAQASQTESAGRIGIRLGSVSELTVIAPFAPGGAHRLRAMLRLLNGNFSGGKKVGTLHDMRFVFLDNDTKFSSRRPSTASGIPISTTSRRRSPTKWTSSSRRSKAGRGFTARM